MTEDKRWHRIDVESQNRELAEEGIIRLEEVGWVLMGYITVETETEEAATVLGSQLAETLSQVPGLKFLLNVGQVSLAAVRDPDAPKDS